MGREYTVSVLERFTKKFYISDDGCWNWTGAISPGGYGLAVVNYKGTTAHRHLYQALFGILPKSIQLDHLCRNRKCVNPKHLEPVTQRENILRGEGFAAKNSLKTICKNGHPYSPENTFKRLRNGKLERDCMTCRKNATRKFYLKKIQKD